MNKPISRNKSLPLSPNLKTGESSDVNIVRVRFSRKGATSFVAHLDMMRIFERAMKRAGINCEYSQGFNPRPVMAFALPLGVGVETIDDYVDITINGPIYPVEMVARLKSAMPDGIDIIGAIKAPSEKDSMMAQVTAAQYMLLAPGIENMQKFIQDAPTLMVIKTSKGVKKTVDVKPLIILVEVVDANSIKVLVKAGSKENLRPDLLLESLAVASYFSHEDAFNTQIIRIGTFILSPDGKLVRPI